VLSPSGDLVDSTTTPLFLPKTERKPRMECGCQEVAFRSSFKVAPPGRSSSSASCWRPSFRRICARKYCADSFGLCLQKNQKKAP